MGFHADPYEIHTDLCAIHKDSFKSLNFADPRGLTWIHAEFYEDPCRKMKHGSLRIHKESSWFHIAPFGIRIHVGFHVDPCKIRKDPFKSR